MMFVVFLILCLSGEIMMYGINIVEGSVMNVEGFRLFSETIYRLHPTVQKAQLWVKSERDENGKLTRYNLFCITYKNGEVQNVTWKNYNPKYYCACICISYDGQLLFLPDYEKGIFVIKIDENTVINRYNLRHIFSIWATDTSLLCLHRESKRLLTRIAFGKEMVEEAVKSDGLNIIPLLERCVLYRKDYEHYVFANPNNLHVSMEIAISEWIGTGDINFNIFWASLRTDGIEAEFFRTDKVDHKNIITERGILSCPDELRNFIENQ